MSQPEQRRSRRVNRSLLIRYRGPTMPEGTWLISPLRDFSSSGARFLTERFFRVGESLDIQLVLPVARDPAVLTGHVVWKRPSTMGLTELGVTFTAERPETQQLIDVAVAQFLRK